MNPAAHNIEWRLSADTMRAFRELLAELEATPQANPRHLQLLDDIKSLPGFPHTADPEADLIHFNVTTERTH